MKKSALFWLAFGGSGIFCSAAHADVGERIFSAIYQENAEGGCKNPHVISLSKDQMVEDVEEIHAVFLAGHANLIRHRSSAEVEEIFERTIGALPDHANEVEFLRMLAPLIGDIRDTHTTIRLSGDGLSCMLSTERFLPLEVMVRDGRVFVATPVYKHVSLEPGAEILSINGRSGEDIVEIIQNSMSFEGYSKEPLQRAMQNNFWYPYHNYVDSSDRFAVTSKGLEGETVEQILEGQSFAEMREVRSVDRPVTLGLEIDQDASVAIMRIAHFLGDDTPDFFRDSFARLKNNSVQNLIIDLRGNGGGYDKYNIDLFKYLLNSSFHYYRGWAHSGPTYEELKNVEFDVEDFFSESPEMSAEEMDQIAQSSTLSQLLDVTIDTFVTAGKHDPYVNLHYDGNVYILVDGASGSSGAEVPAMAHHFGVATIVGEEPNGAYQGTAGGVIPELTLPNSKLRVNFPLVRYYNAVMPDVYPHTGVQPHFRVLQTPEDLAAGRDTILDFTRELIKSRAGGAPLQMP